MGHSSREKRPIVDIIVIAVIALAFPRIAGAQYVDPGNASLYWQLLLSALAGGLFMFRSTLRNAFYAVTRLIRKRPSDTPPDAPAE